MNKRCQLRSILRPAVQQPVQARTPVVARPTHRIDDTYYRPLSTHIRTIDTPSIATRVVFTDALITTRRLALLQIPIVHRS